MKNGDRLSMAKTNEERAELIQECNTYLFLNQKTFINQEHAIINWLNEEFEVGEVEE